MYFAEHNALYLHPGKTAGTSIEKLFIPGKRDATIEDRERLFGWDKENFYYLQHATARSARDVMGLEKFEACYRFTTVRNPYSRLISVYHYTFPHHEERFGGFREFVLQLPELTNQKSALKGNHYSPQYLFATIDDEEICHRIVKFENINDDFQAVARDLDCELSLENLHRYRHDSFPTGEVADRYDDDMISAMRIAYADDFRLFGYDDTPQGRL